MTTIYIFLFMHSCLVRIAFIIGGGDICFRHTCIILLHKLYCFVYNLMRYSNVVYTFLGGDPIFCEHIYLHVLCMHTID